MRAKSRQGEIDEHDRSHRRHADPDPQRPDGRAYGDGDAGVQAEERDRQVLKDEGYIEDFAIREKAAKAAATRSSPSRSSTTPASR
jgi:hypothetical protein